MKNLTRRLVVPALAVTSLALGGCKTLSDINADDLKHSAREVVGAPVSFVVGAARQAEQDPFQAAYDLTGRAASEAGRVINGVLYPATRHKYEAEFGSAEIHPMADNNTVKMAGWGIVAAPVAAWSYVEGLLAGTGIGAVMDYFSEEKK
ncbi:hypothetical protein COU59_02985 [Candidatus Pacearchaeota archaeon CG10_big_fil_rev_8_21_14_0_10_34_12]|nr:MAG: hypothetical protein COU59_02985 [Candidatus Pacearchaeota archaeon CG10_big_fil_rev_8_21_14_0_10_34_12]